MLGMAAPAGEGSMAISNKMSTTVATNLDRIISSGLMRVEPKI
jgi:hypothetical protein